MSEDAETEGRIDIKKLKEYLERELMQIEERAKVIRNLLEVLNACMEADIKVSEGKEYRNASGKPVARLVERRDSMMLVFTKPIPESLPYIKYALTMLERFRGEGMLEYSVEKREKGIISILTTNIDKSVRDDVHAILEFVAEKIKSLEKS
jgi:hypothetical protein